MPKAMHNSYDRFLEPLIEVARLELKITLSEKATSALEERARERGCDDVNKYVEQLIATDLLAAQSFDEILSPIRKTFQESAMSEDDLDALFEEARDEVYQERKAREQ